MGSFRFNEGNGEDRDGGVCKLTVTAPTMITKVIRIVRGSLYPALCIEFGKKSSVEEETGI